MGADRDRDDTDEGETTDAQEPIRATWEREDPDTITSSVVRAVAEAAGFEPMGLPQPLHDVVDPDALSRMLGSSRGDGTVTVTFELAGQSVTVSDDGEITVVPADSRSQS